MEASSKEHGKILAKKFGHRVAQLRKELNMTQETMAEEAGISREYLSRIEKGTGVSWACIASLSQALKVPVKDLFEFEDEENKEELIQREISLLKLQNTSIIKKVYKITRILLERN